MADIEKKSRKSLSLLDKVAVLQALKEQTATKAELARRYKVHRATIRKIERNAAGILEAAAGASNKEQRNRKYVSSGKHRQLEEAVFLWFLNQRRLNLIVTTSMIQTKAKLFAPKFDIPETVRFSEHWAHNFKRRHGIRKLKICGEELSCDTGSIEAFREKFLEEVAKRKLTAAMIYNADESGLFFKMLPDGTLVSADEKKAAGRKILKDRVTFMPCANVTGTHKLPMVVIGKSKNPRAMKNVRVPVKYMASKNAWMTRTLFKEWFFNDFVPGVRRHAAEQGIAPSALLLLDNCSAHHVQDKLESDDGLITVFFLPPNVTAMIQPMDQNVIQNVKLNYREKLLIEVMGKDANDKAEEELAKVNMKDVCFWLHDTWDLGRVESRQAILEKNWDHP